MPDSLFVMLGGIGAAVAAGYFALLSARENRKVETHDAAENGVVAGLRQQLIVSEERLKLRDEQLQDVRADLNVANARISDLQDRLDAREKGTRP